MSKARSLSCAVLGLALAASSLMAAAPASAEPPVGCAWSRSELPAPTGFAGAQLHTSSANGKYHLGDYYETRYIWAPNRQKILNKVREVLWENGSVARYVRPGEYVSWGAVNSSGVVVGSARYGDEWHAVRFLAAGGHDRLPGDPTWTSSAALNINDNGDIFGFGYTRDNQTVPVLWPAAKPSTFWELKTPHRVVSLLNTAIDNQGWIAADLRYSTGAEQDSFASVTWDASGTLRELANAAPDPYHGLVGGIRAGVVAGTTNGVNRANEVAAEWDEKGNKTRELPGGVATKANAIGGQGTVGGSYRTTMTMPIKEYPVLWRGGAVLARLPFSGGVGSQFSALVSSVSDSGLAAAGSERRPKPKNSAEDPGTLSAVVWNCA